MTFVHTADWQLGKPFGSIAGDAAAVLRDERFNALTRLGRLARERQVDAVLVAGDVFDSPTVPDQVLRRAVEAMRAYPGPWVLLPGNHDPALAESPWTRLQRIGVPENVRPAVARAPLLLADGRLAVLPAPLARRHEPDDVSEWMDGCETPSEVTRIGLAHGSVAGHTPEGDARNQISDTRVARARLAYLALGDWHGTREIGPAIWYSGTPEPDRFRNNEPGNALIVTVDAPGAPARVERVRVGHYEWCECTVTCGVDGAEDPAGRVEAAIGAVAGRAPERVLLRLVLKGTATLAGRERIEDCLNAWQARLRYLERNLDHLVDEPNADDLDAIDRGGFVRRAVDRLVAKAGDAADPERELARTALRLLYLEHMGAEG
ncbi:MAG: metallophosphoesterase family protein [Acetobacteraceae bacterium]